MAGNNYKYSPASGEAFTLGTQDSMARALADIGDRLGALEAAKSSGSASADGDRLARLEAVVQPFFRDEFADFDTANAGNEQNGKTIGGTDKSGAGNA